jgi:hypothetical protein
MAKQDALQGSLPLLVLKILDRRGPLHGYGIAAQIEAVSSLPRRRGIPLSGPASPGRIGLDPRPVGHHR